MLSPPVTYLLNGNSWWLAWVIDAAFVKLVGRPSLEGPLISMNDYSQATQVKGLAEAGDQTQAACFECQCYLNTKLLACT